jgi:Protein of unknown function (DUF2848)
MTIYTHIKFDFLTNGSSQEGEVAVTDLVLAGWTGRDRAALELHIDEMEKLGIRRPPSLPVFYRVSAARLTRADAIEVCGADSSGEAEFVLIRANNGLWIGAGSDHTDRKVESYGITVSKQMYDKPMAAKVWEYGDVADHWDSLVLRSWADGKLYQEASVATMLAPAELIAGFTGGEGALPEGTVMFSGTIATHGGLKPATHFRFELEDPVLGRSLQHEYRIRPLPVVG